MKISQSTELIRRIRDLSGMRVTELDFERLDSWVQRRMNVLGLKDQDGYLHYLNGPNDLAEDRRMLSELLTTGETFFMRDPGQMELIRRAILPEIISRKSSNKQIRIWAPACATGEEIYSLIILLEKVLPNTAGWEIDVVGSDINPEFIEQAKHAVYREWAFRGCDQDFKNAYFQKTEAGWKLIDRIRSRARFLVFNLVNERLPDISNHLVDIDFILCRNLFIYMNLDSISLITDKLSSCLLSGGVLMTAHGELHAYRQSGLNVKIYPESLVYEKPEVLIALNVVESTMSQAIKTSEVDAAAFRTINKEVAVTSPPKSIPELLGSAWAYADRGGFNEALEIYKEIIARDSMQAEPYYLHAVISLEKGDVDRAKEDLRKTLYLDENFIPAYLDLITIQIQEGKEDLAAKTCEQALRSIQAGPENLYLPGLRNAASSDVREYLINLQKSLTSPSD
ncbi:CheR family methyltransferase [Polynucleobacter sp. MG-27-Goln-C1]|uniref:CheR family methyltransferase n=1 Tax=Polynucleobacter sp. MG-27-Goln-C1 TaxID=1819726 RepID=UPI001C0CC698|nr:CheR family methyltransferase [Polynucleobacter sp. MG-27-Goln-C1]MBU3613235.1 hypothetical protein [Polynucleobacter sp. MG-27-Goln-C1]